MKNFIYAASALAALFFIASPAHAQKGWWEYYDVCPQKPFVKMIECGNRARNEFCKKPGSRCSDLGNSVVQYAGNLAAAVRSGEMSANAAERRWIEFKIKTKAMMENSGSGLTFCSFGYGSGFCY